MERAKIQLARFVAEKCCAPLPHFAGSFVRERHRKDAVRVHLVFTDEVGNAPGDHPRLATSRPGKYEQGALTPRDGPLLGLIQARNDVAPCTGTGHGASLTSVYLPQPFAMAPTMAAAILNCQRLEEAPRGECECS
jgi:hypothetical protein